MALPFSQTLRSTASDSLLPLPMLLSVLLMLAAWACWFAVADVPIYSASADARIEVETATYWLDSPVNGRLVQWQLAPGQPVKAGEVLGEVDSRESQMQLQVEQMKAVAGAQIALPIEEQIRAERRSAEAATQRFAAAQRQAAAEIATVEAERDHARSQAGRARGLREIGVVSEAEAERVEAEARALDRRVEGLRAAAQKLASEARTDQEERAAKVAELESLLRREQSAARLSGAEARRLEVVVAEHKLIAPVSGTVAEAAPLRPGAVVTAGQRLAAVIPQAAARLVAFFSPEEAAGRMKPGQKARVRLLGFPWTRYGWATARVTAVDREVRDRRIRVELEIVDRAQLSAPMEHGMPVNVEVEIERSTPLQLVLRVAGKAFTAGAAAGEGHGS